MTHERPSSAPPDTPGNALSEILKERIRAAGPLTFAEFMEACLYHPEHGYYTRSKQRRLGDYYTSVDMHPVFGRLLARQLAEMWERSGRPSEFFAVECGAGAGFLARHILDFARGKLPEFYAGLQYVAVERSAVRRTQLQARLAGHGSSGKWTSLEELPARIPAGCVFSNELLDAFPVHRVRQDSSGLQEIYVGWSGGKFVEQCGPPSSPRVTGYFAEQGITLTDGAEAEAGLAVCDWVTAVGDTLGRGFVLTIDYGHEARELYNERHRRGTLLGYFQHAAHEDYFARPGEQDLTAHVNFTALDLWGRKSGLTRAGLASQSHFLMALGKENEFADLYDEGMGETERVQARLKLKSLIFPEGMGEAFSVMVQAKGLPGDVSLRGFGNL